MSTREQSTRKTMGFAGTIALSLPIALQIILQITIQPIVANAAPDVFPKVTKATELVKAAKYPEAIVLYKEILAQIERNGNKPEEQLTKVVTLFGLGRVYENISDPKNAIETYEIAEKLARKIGDPTIVASVLNNLGTVYVEKGNYVKAQEIFSQGLDVAAQAQRRYGELITLANLDSKCSAAKTEESSAPNQLMRQFCTSALPKSQMVESFNQVRANYRKQARALEARSLNNLSLLYDRQGNYPESLRNNTQSVEIERSLGNEAGESTSLNNMAGSHASMGDYVKALSLYEQSLKLSEKVNDRSQRSRTIGNIGYVYSEQGNYQKSNEQYQKALEIAKAISDRNHEAVLYNNLATNAQFLGQFNESKALYDKALVIYRETGNRPGEITTLNNLGVFQSTIGDYPKALISLDTALKGSVALGQKRVIAMTYSNLAQLNNDQGLYAKGLDYYQKSLDIQKAIGSRGDEVGTLISFGISYGLLGRSAKGETYCNQALDLAKSMNTRGTEATALSCLAKLRVDAGQFVESQELLDRALVSNRTVGNRRSEVILLRTQAKLNRRTNRLPQALRSLTDALKIASELGIKPEEATLLSDLGELQIAMGQPATTTLQQAIQLSETLGDRVTQGKALTALGASQLSQPTIAQSSLESAIKIWESMRPGLADNDKVSLFESQEKTYHLLEQSLIAQQKNELALEVSERGRARAFIELLASKTNTSNTALPTFEAPTISEIKSIAAAEKATIVQYSVVSNQELYIWVIKPNGQVKFAVSRLTTPITELVIENRDMMGVRGRKGSIASQTTTIAAPNTNQARNQASNDQVIDPSLRSLHQVLIEPIASELPSDENSRIIFVPHNAIFMVPFNALLNSTGKALIDRHTITTAPSIQSLALTRKLRKPVGTTIPLIVGNPKMPLYEGTPLPALPGAETEAQAIATLFNTKALIGIDASKSVVLDRMKTATTIHLATHGLLDTLRGEVPGAIALTPSAGNDGFLTASEILDLKLNADLVVLSACSTGRGDITGDGVIGLSRSLFVAGVPSVLVSLWNVRDQSTALLMTEFYKNYQTRKLAKSIALRQAMLTTRQQYPQAADWAAFNLVGESD